VANRDSRGRILTQQPMRLPPCGEPRIGDDCTAVERDGEGHPAA
jgi:hypothetical protein